MVQFLNWDNRSCGIEGGQSGTVAGFLRVLRFLLPILILPTAPHSSSYIIRGWYNRPVSGRRTEWIQSHLAPKKNINLEELWRRLLLLTFSFCLVLLIMRSFLLLYVDK
jgi:hypothetical protein